MQETILLVDDDSMVLRLLSESLRHEGYSVLSASSGKDALALATAHRGSLDLLLTDVSMPHMGGGEVAERLCATLPETRVIFMSGYVENPHLIKIRQSKAKFLAKPFTPATLRRIVRECLDGPWEGLGLGRDM